MCHTLASWTFHQVQLVGRWAIQFGLKRTKAKRHTMAQSPGMYHTEGDFGESSVPGAFGWLGGGVELEVWHPAGAQSLAPLGRVQRALQVRVLFVPEGEVADMGWSKIHLEPL